MTRANAVVLSLAILSGSTPLHAQDDALSREACIDTLDDATARAWADTAERRLLHTEHRARRWFFSWVVVNAAFVVGASIYAGVMDDPLQRDAGIWGAAGSGATLALLFAPPLSTVFASRRLRHVSDEDRADPRRRLVHVLAALERGASQERAQRSPVLHVLNAAFSLSEGLYLGLRYDHSTLTALGNVFGTLIVAETQILTTPRGAERSLRRIRADGAPCLDMDARPVRAARSVTVEPLASGVRVRF